MRLNIGAVIAYIISLVGGVIVFSAGFIGLVWFGAGGPSWGGVGRWMNEMMRGYHSFVGGGEYAFFSVISILGLISGAVMILSAVMLRMRPRDNLIWGTLILLFALVSFVDMGGYFIGALLGIVGGAIAISSPRYEDKRM